MSDTPRVTPELLAVLESDDPDAFKKWLEQEVVKAIHASPEYQALQREMHEEELDILYGTNRHKKPVINRAKYGIIHVSKHDA